MYINVDIATLTKLNCLKLVFLVIMLEVNPPEITLSGLQNIQKNLITDYF